MTLSAIFFYSYSFSLHLFVSQKSLNEEERGGNCLLLPERSYGPAFKYTVTLKPGLRSLYVIENYTIQCGTHDFLLTFLSNYRPISHRFRDKRRYPSKVANFSTPVY